MPESTAIAYKYALRPNAAQAQALSKAAWRGRRIWNALVAVERWAERECRNGRKASLVVRYDKLLSQKQLVGRRVTEARKIEAELGVTRDEALRLLRQRMVERDSRTIHRKDGTKSRRATIRQLAIRYAIESVTAHREKFGTEALAFWSIVQKFQDATDLYTRGLRARPRFKRRGDPVTLQFQVTGTANSPVVGDRVDLSKLFGKTGARVNVLWHRPLPASAKIKQVAVATTATRLAVVFMLEVPSTDVAKGFPACGGAVAGVDPGRKVALTVSSADGRQQQAIQAPLFRDMRLLRKLRRCQRKHDRQRRKNNPDAFNEDGTWKKGVSAPVVSRNMVKTHARITEMQRHIADTRQEHYRLAAREMLSRFDTVGVGTWRGGTAPGVGKAKRAQQRKDYDHAISLFVAILKDFAKRSVTVKRVEDIPEAGTTRTCPACGQATGPTGLAGLSVREWTCAHCHSRWQRDFAAAQAIARRTCQIIAAGTQPVSEGRKARIQPARAPKARTKVGDGDIARSPRVAGREVREAPSSKVGAVASAAVVVQPSRSARAPVSVVGERVERSGSLDTATSRPQDGHRSQSGTDGPNDEIATTDRSQ